MSDDLNAKIEAVISKHLAESGGGFLGSWFLVATFIDDEGEQAWLHQTAPDQRMQDTLGLVEWGRGICDYEQRRYLEELEGDE